MEVIINIDGGSRGNPGPGASAWVIKDVKGKLLTKDGVFFQECTNNQAEFTALALAMQKAAELGAKKLTIRSDSLLLVKQYAGSYKIKNPRLKELMGEIKEIAAEFTSVKLVHVPREQNKEADEMCNIIMDKALKKPAAKTQSKPAAPAGPAKTAEIKKTAPEKQPRQLEFFDMENF
jgi:ribonuclease HI